MKHKLLGILKQNQTQDQNEYISGEMLCKHFGVSRTAIFKHIKALKDEGYRIESSTKKGYRLVAVPESVSEFEISFGLETDIIGKKICYLKEVNSTNTFARKIALDGAPEGTLVIAETQTQGKGRLGRDWSSMDGKGIWTSIILRPKIAPQDVQLITLAASVAVASALEKTTGIKPGIKWPNDIILDGKKVCGILTEMNSEMEMVNFLILGIGINVNHCKEDFPLELQDTAVSLRMYLEKNNPKYDKIISRSNIIKKLLYELEQIYYKINDGQFNDIISSWKEYSTTLGKHVKVMIRDEVFLGIAEDIMEDGRLVVKCNDGVVREVLSGEVSIRGILGYD